MKQLIGKFASLFRGSATAVGNLCRRLTEPRPNELMSRLDALENALQIQAALNETVEVQLKMVHTLLQNAQRRMLIMTIALIAIATIAAIALAMALLR